MTSFKPKDNKYHGHAHDSLRIYLFNSAFLASQKIHFKNLFIHRHTY